MPTRFRLDYSLEFLPMDLMMEIFCRLPMKSLIRCKSVSKSCRDLIEDPSFIGWHKKRSTPKILSLSLEDAKLHLLDRKMKSTLLYGLENHTFAILVGSCNGLACLFDLEDNIIICNPATKEHLIIPYPSNANNRRGYAFGHETVGDDYKVVLMEELSGSDDEFTNSVSMVYSLKKNRWTRNLHAPYVFLNRTGVLVNGFVHWAIVFDTKTGTIITRFDLQSEEFCAKVPLPDNTTILFLELGVLGGCLLLVGTEGTPTSLSTVWMMKDYMIKDSWTKVYEFILILVPYALSSPDIPIIKLCDSCVCWDRYTEEEEGKTRHMAGWLEIPHSAVYEETLVQIGTHVGLQL